MRRLVEFPLQDGGSVQVEVDDGPVPREVTRGWADRDRRVVDQAPQCFEQAVACAVRGGVGGGGYVEVLANGTTTEQLWKC